jgi:hypothetical protein
MANGTILPEPPRVYIYMYDLYIYIYIYIYTLSLSLSLSTHTGRIIEKVLRGRVQFNSSLNMSWEFQLHEFK